MAGLPLCQVTHAYFFTMWTLERFRPLMRVYPGLLTFDKGLYGH